MQILEIIRKKRDGNELTKTEIEFFVDGYVSEAIPDYQISALLMAIYFQGMTNAETSALTQSMIQSGKTLSLPSALGPYVDKHSTGGVGDKISLILAPAVAACGVHIPMMSGRALGHTGGTLDKLESIPGYSTQLSEERFVEIIRDCGFAMTGQSKGIVPADRLLYALRDVTATVESIPLITASILSKKFAEGSDALIFDVKCGRGAFMTTLDQAEKLAASLVRTSAELNKKCFALITDMSEPLGRCVGNFLEVEESIACLEGKGSDDLVEVTCALGAYMLMAAGKAATYSEGQEKIMTVLNDGTALQRFIRNVELQGGNVDEMFSMIGTHRSPVCNTVYAEADGWIRKIDALSFGLAGIPLGVGRSKTTDAVYSDVGFLFHTASNERVRHGDPLYTVYAHDAPAVEAAMKYLEQAITIAEVQPTKRTTLVYKEITS